MICVITASRRGFGDTKTRRAEPRSLQGKNRMQNEVQKIPSHELLSSIFSQVFRSLSFFRRRRLEINLRYTSYSAGQRSGSILLGELLIQPCSDG